MLNRFGRERQLYRIGISEYHDEFLLKGAWAISRNTRSSTNSSPVRRTFAVSSTPLPQQVPLGLSSEFGEALDQQAQWRAFLQRNELAEVSLPAVVSQIREGLVAMLLRAGELSRRRGSTRHRHLFAAGFRLR